MVRLEASLGRQIRRARERKGWTQQDLVDQLDRLGLPMSRPTLLRLERGPRNGGRAISVQEWLTLAAVLEVPPLLLLMPLGVEDEVAVTGELVMHPHLAMDWITGETGPGHNAIPGQAPFAIGDAREYQAAAAPLRAWRDLRSAQEAFFRAEVNVRSIEGMIERPLPSRSSQAHLDALAEDRRRAIDECRRLAPAFRDALERLRDLGMRPPAYGRSVVEAFASSLAVSPDTLIAELGLELMDDPEDER